MFHFMMILMTICLDIWKGICGYLIHKLCFYDKGFLVNLLRNSVEFSVEITVLELNLISWFHIGHQVSVFKWA